MSAGNEPHHTSGYMNNHQKIDVNESVRRGKEYLRNTCANLTPPAIMPFIPTTEEVEVARGNMFNVLGGEGSRDARRERIEQFFVDPVFENRIMVK